MKINQLALMKLYRSFIATPLLLSRNRCPTPEAILRSLRAKASRREREKITSHISRCSSCAREVDFILKTFREENKLFRRLDAVMETAKPNVFFPRPTWKYATVLIPAILIISFTITFLLQTLERSQLRGKSDSYIILEQPRNKLTPEEINFQWSKIPTSEYYILEIFDKTLYPIWQSNKIIKNKTSPPMELINRLCRGESYFWMVTAFLPDGTKIESSLADFTVKKIAVY